MKNPQIRIQPNKVKKYDPYGVRPVFAFFLFLVIPLYLSNIQPEYVTIKLCSTNDGKLVCGIVKIIDKIGNKTTLDVARQESLRLPTGEYTISVDSPGFEPNIDIKINIDQDVYHELSIGVVPQAQIFGIVSNGVTNKPIFGLEVNATKDGKSYKSITDTDGIYNIVLPEGQYNLTINNPNYKAFSSEFFLKSGQIKNEQLYTLPNDLSSIPLSEYKSYSLFGTRNGSISGFTQDLNVIMKKNYNNEYLITQHFKTGWTGGDLNMVIKDKVGYYSEGQEYKIFDNDGLTTAKLMIKTQENLWVYLLNIRQDFDTTTKVIGQEQVNNVDCNKIEVKNTAYINWIGKSIFEFTSWEIIGGKLRTLPTKMAGTMRGWDEYGHEYKISFDLSVTDIGQDFKMPEIGQ